jgi:hypothetical protein
MLYAVSKMKLTARFTYVIIVAVAVNLLGRLFYFLTHPFTLALEQPKLNYLTFGFLSSLFLYGLARRLEPNSAKRVATILAVAALLRTVSYLVNRYVLNQWTLGLILYLLVVGAEMTVVYFCLIHLKELRSS